MEDRDKRTLYCGNLSDKVTDELLYELFLQAGPLESVKIPKDKSGRSKYYAFITFKHDVSVPYSIALMSGVSLFGRELRLEPRLKCHPSNQYLKALQEHHRVNNGPINSSTPTDHHRLSDMMDRRNPYGNGIIGPYPDSRRFADFVDPDRRHYGTPLGSRSFTEGMPPQRMWQNSSGVGFSPVMDVLTHGVSPLNFAGDMKMRSFNDRFNMFPSRGPLSFRDRTHQ